MKQEEKVSSLACCLVPAFTCKIKGSLSLTDFKQNLVSHGYKALAKLQMWLAEGQL